MTDRYHSLTVALDKDTRDDDAEALIAAIKQLRGVAGVEGNVVDTADFVHAVRTNNQLGELMSGLHQAIIRGGVKETTRVLEDVKPRSGIL